MTGSVVDWILEHTNLPCPIASIIGDFCVPTVFQGHTDFVRSLAIPSDNKYLYSGSDDHTIRQWAIGDEPVGSSIKQCLRRFEGHTGWVQCLAISSDNKYLYSGSSDRTIRQWCIETGQCLQSFKGHTHWIRSLAISLDNKYLYSGSIDNTIRQWAIDYEPTSSPGGTGQLVQSFQGHTDWVRSLSISPDNKYLYSGSDDKTIYRWTLSNPKNPTIYRMDHPVHTLHCTSTSLFYSQGDQIHQMLCCPFLDQSIQ